MPLSPKQSREGFKPPLVLSNHLHLGSKNGISHDQVSRIRYLFDGSRNTFLLKILACFIRRFLVFASGDDVHNDRLLVFEYKKSSSPFYDACVGTSKV